MKNLIYKILLLFLTVIYLNMTEVHAQEIDESFAQECANALDLTLSQRYEEAIPVYENIIATLKKQNSSPEKMASWLKGLGTCKFYTGKIGEAENIYLEALKSIDAPQYANAKIVRQLLDALSVLYVQTQNYEKANKYNGKAKISYEENIDFGDDYVWCLSNAALIQAGMGYNTIAKMLVDVSLRQAKSNLNDQPAYSETINNLSSLIGGNGNASLKENSYIIFRILPYISMLNNASQIYQQLGYYSDAVKIVKESIQIAEKYGLSVPWPYNNLGTLYLSKSRFQKASECFQKSYALCRVPYEIDELGMNAALGLYLSNDTTAALFCSDYSAKMRGNIKEMFAFMSGEERAIYWKHFENYLPMINLIIYESGNDTYFGAIYDNILESKGLLLRSTNAIRDAILQSGNDSDLADFARMGQLKQKLMTESDDAVRESLNKEIEDIDKRLTRHVTTYADFAASNSINWENVRDALSDNDVAIEFYNIPLIWGRDSIQTLDDGEPRYCAVLLRKDYTQPHIVPLCKESRLDNIEKEDIYESDSIYRMIWEPLEEELKGVNNIYFAADRELHKIGIEYAPMPNGDNMGKKYNIYRLSSTRLLAEKKNERRYDHAVLYGGLRYDVDKDVLIAESRSGDYHPTSTSRAFTAENSRYGVKYLPGTLKEVEDISQNFSNKPRLITDISGTEESFKSLAGSSIDIIHLATHGFFWSEDDARKRDYVTFLNPGNRAKQSEEDKVLTRSGLFFSGANIGLQGKTLPDDVEDGVLTALELSNMNLGHVDMVVMSACESGLGETSGEGVFGLQRGFKLAGANTLLMSLWKVDDAATKLLMTEFYQNYLSGKPKRESLRLAQQSLRNNPDYSDPEYWAAFILLDGLN